MRYFATAFSICVEFLEYRYPIFLRSQAYFVQRHRAAGSYPFKALNWITGSRRFGHRSDATVGNHPHLLVRKDGIQSFSLI
jgi:hypothetical protein